MATKQINLRLDDSLLARIDEERGLIPRNAWIVSKLIGTEPIKQAFSEPIVPLLGEPPPPKATRSPEPAPEPTTSRADVFRRATEKRH